MSMIRRACWSMQAGFSKQHKDGQGMNDAGNNAGWPTAVHPCLCPSANTFLLHTASSLILQPSCVQAAGAVLQNMGFSDDR